MSISAFSRVLPGMASTATPVSRLARHLGITSMLLGLSRAIGFTSFMILSPFLVRTYGMAGLGAYAAVTSTNAFLAALDSGVGASVRTQVAELAAVDRQRDALSATLRSLSRSVWTWVSSGALLGVALSLLLPWEDLLKAPAVLPGNTARYVMAAFTAIYLLGCRQQVYSRALEGMSRSGTAALVTAFPPLVVLSASLYLCAMDSPLFVVIAVAALSPLLSGLAARACLSTSGGQAGAATALPSRIRASLALPMMAIGLCYAFAYSLDYWVISAFLGAERTAVYSAAARPAQLMLVVASAAAPVLWTHFTMSRHRNDPGDMSRRVLLQLLGFFAVGGAATALVFLVTVRALGSTLTDGAASPPLGLVVAFACWGTLLIAHQPLAMTLNDAEGLRWQLGSMLAMTCVNVPMSILLVSLLGAQGPVWASCAALGLVHIPLLAYRALLARPRNES